MYTLYSFPISQHCRRVLALLDEAGLDYEIQHVALNEGAHQADDYLELNPVGQVPVLVTPELTLLESNAMLRYVCNAHGLDDWYPTTPGERAHVDQWLDWNQCRLGPSVVDIVLNRVFMGDAGDEGAIERGEAALPQHLEVLDAALLGRPYVAGNHPTIADLSIASNITHLAFAGVSPEGSATRAWLDRMCAIPGFAAHVPALEASPA